MNIGQMLKLELSKGKSLKDIEKEEYYVSCFVPKSLDCFRNVKPTKVRIKFRDFERDMGAIKEEKFYEVIDSVDIDFKVHDKFDSVVFFKTIQELSSVTQIYKLSNKGTLSSEPLRLYTFKMDKKPIARTCDLDVKIFKTREEAKEFYEERRILAVDEINEAVEEYKKEIAKEGQKLIKSIEKEGI